MSFTRMAGYSIGLVRPLVVARREPWMLLFITV